MPRKTIVAVAGATVIALVALFRCPNARAGEPAGFVYEREPNAEVCADGAALRAAVSDMLGYDPFATNAPRTVIIHVARGENGFFGTVRIDLPGGGSSEERPLHASECPDLMAALALTVSVAIDPLVALRPRPARLASTPPKLSPPPAPLPPLPKWRRSAGFGPTFTTGDAPAPVVGAMVYVAAEKRYFGGVLDARATFPGSTRTALGTASSWSANLGLAACLRLSVSFLCGVGIGGVVDAYGDGVASSKHATALVASAGARLGIAIPLSDRFELRTQAEALRSLSVHHIAIQGTDVYEFPLGSLGLAAALGVRF